jgi:hypothetical protein
MQTVSMGAWIILSNDVGATLLKRVIPKPLPKTFVRFLRISQAAFVRQTTCGTAEAACEIRKGHKQV